MNAQCIKLEFELHVSPNCRSLYSERPLMSALRAPGSRNSPEAESPWDHTLPSHCRVSRLLYQGWLVTFLTAGLGALHGQQQGLSLLCRYQEMNERVLQTVQPLRSLSLLPSALQAACPVSGPSWILADG